MSEIVQLYADDAKTIKAYPKTLASQVYIDGTETVAERLDSIIEHCTGGNGMQEHSHINKTILDEISEDVDGTLLYEGKPINAKDKELINARTDYFNKEHLSVADRLNADFDNVHQRINDSSLLEYTGTNITANNSYYGLTKDLSIKGRTLQNLISSAISKGTKINSSSIKDKEALLKINTTYTLIANITNVVNSPSGTIPLGLYGRIKNNDDSITAILDSATFTKGIKVIKFKTSEIASPTYFEFMWIRNFEEGMSVDYEYMILEGDYTNTPLSELPFIEGIKSVGELENKVTVKSCGKNLFDGINFEKGKYYNTNGSENFTKEYSSINIKCKNGTTYSQNISKNIITFWNNGNFIASYTNKNTFTTPINCDEIRLSCLTSFINEFQLEENTVSTTYEPYQETKQELTLSEPLRSLPNGVCDEIIGDKLIRRVGKVVLDGSEDWTQTSNYDTETYKTFSIIPTNSIKEASYNFLNDKFINISSLSGVDRESMWFGSSTVIPIRIKINKTKLISPDATGFKTWLQENHTTVYYELATPTIETISPLIINSFDGVTHITSDNLLLPTITAKVPSNVQAVVMDLKEENNILSKEVSVLNMENKELKEESLIHEAKIADSEEVINFLLMNLSAAMTLNAENNLERGTSYLAKQIYQGKLDYDQVVLKYPNFKEHIDMLLKSYMKNDRGKLNV